MSRTTSIALLMAAGLSLSACEGVKEQLGVTKQSPDEFRVVARAPLTVPPEFSLRPPQPGAVRPQEGTPSDQARTAIFRNEGGATTQREVEVIQGRSTGEASLLLNAGAGSSDPEIRSIVDRETNAINEESESFIRDLIFWKDEEVPPGTVVDPQGETDRIRENQAIGAPITTGETPTIEREEGGLLD